MLTNKRILVTGGSGMIGKALQNHLEGNVFFLSSEQCNLLNFHETIDFFNLFEPDYVIHLAAKVGGIVANMNHMGDFYRENILINTNVLEASRIFNVKKVLSLLSTCIYPDNSQWPLTEDQIHNGRPHQSNFAYAHAKRMLDVQSRAYRKQYGCNFITAVPNNLFGKHDNFDLENSHVIPAMIRKTYEAKMNKKDVILWGTGLPLREFTYSEDLAKILIFLLEEYNDPEPINIGSTNEISIGEVACLIATMLNFNGEIIWDTSRPDGQYRKPSDNSKLINLGWDPKNYTDYGTALKDTCEWAIHHYPNLRGVR